MILNKIPTVDIIGSLVSEFNASLADASRIKSIEDLGGDSYKINTCDTGWARVKSVIQIGGNSYEVTAFEQGVSLTVTGANDPAGAETFTLPAVNYFHDTIKGQEHTVTELKDLDLKWPMLWLYEVFVEDFNDDKNIRLDRTSPLRIFILDNANTNNWDVNQHYENAINQMLNLAETFNNFLLTHGSISDFDQHSVTSYKNFGKFVEDGADKWVIPEYCSGVEYRVSLPINKNYECRDC